ncbi:hypothetical protein WOLCODRAFT_158725 [Wolfiporia cocos MD-104 SS10]|uniref:Uncharacterized protein n=1 Tax=Wolfiporia cocos (strain MD-104) TaxID=742152 RepID=A0A2H3JAF6_WOLCO|nr:hypothetical protein WOLCODRAFT_158725 [Wolfiporia cocos MD-104 SS10]
MDTHKPSGTSNNLSDCRKHPGQHQWKDCPDNQNRKTPESKSSGSGSTKPSGSSSGSQQSGQKKLDPKKKYKVRVVSTQELVTDDEDESPKATVGTLSADHPHILEEVVPLALTTRISEEEKSGESISVNATTPVQAEPAGPTSPGEIRRKDFL